MPLKLVLGKAGEPLRDAVGIALGLPVEHFRLAGKLELPRLDRVSQDVPDQTQPPAGLQDPAHFGDRRLGVEPMPGISNQDRVQRSIFNRYRRRVGLVAPGGRIVPGQHSEHSWIWLNRLHGQAARQKP